MLCIRLQWACLRAQIRTVSMPAADKSPAIIELERNILHALCRESAELDTQSRASAVSELLSHNWQDPEHRVVFDALTRLPGRDAAELQRQLPAQATRMGFPDVPWETYFAGGRPDHTKRANEHRTDLETLIAQLRTASAETCS
jgi:hypothetical protein